MRSFASTRLCTFERTRLCAYASLRRASHVFSKRRAPGRERLRALLKIVSHFGGVEIDKRWMGDRRLEREIDDGG